MAGWLWQWEPGPSLVYVPLLKFNHLSFHRGPNCPSGTFPRIKGQPPLRAHKLLNHAQTFPSTGDSTRFHWDFTSKKLKSSTSWVSGEKQKAYKPPLPRHITSSFPHLPYNHRDTHTYKLLHVLWPQIQAR